MPTSSFSQSRIASMKNCVGAKSRGTGQGRYCPSPPSDHPHSPGLARCGVLMWSVGAARPVQQPEQTRYSRLCIIRLPLKLFSILSSIILWVRLTVQTAGKLYSLFIYKKNKILFLIIYINLLVRSFFFHSRFHFTNVLLVFLLLVDVVWILLG